MVVYGPPRGWGKKTVQMAIELRGRAAGRVEVGCYQYMCWHPFMEATLAAASPMDRGWTAK
jgi:hypothetical protein